MATQTTNLHLTKPDGSEKVNIATINTNMDTIDTYAGTNNASIINLAEDIGVVVNGNKTKSGVTAAVGQYVILKNSTISNRVDGLYTAAKAIPANTAIDASYLTAVSGGGLNTLNSKIESKTWTPTANDTLLGYILNTVGITDLPKTFTKNGDAVVSDAPFGSEEYVVTLTGNNTRVHVEVTKYNAGTGEIPYTYQRDIFNGAWRRDSWVSLNAKVDRIGVMAVGTNNSATVSIADNTGVELNSVTVNEAGTYLLIGAADWAPNGNGYRQLAFADPVNPGRNLATTTLAIDNKETFQQVMQIVATTGQSTYKIYGRQTSGSTINCYPYLIAVRI